jgi:hypothetical protein
MQPGQSVAQNVTITGLPRKSFRAIFLPVIVVKVSSGAPVEKRFIEVIEKNARINKKDANKMYRYTECRIFTGTRGNCSGIWVNVSLGNTGIIAKLLNCAFFNG